MWLVIRGTFSSCHALSHRDLGHRQSCQWKLRMSFSWSSNILLQTLSFKAALYWKPYHGLCLIKSRFNLLPAIEMKLGGRQPTFQLFSASKLLFLTQETLDNLCQSAWNYWRLWRWRRGTQPKTAMTERNKNTWRSQCMNSSIIHPRWVEGRGIVHATLNPFLQPLKKLLTHWL